MVAVLDKAPLTFDEFMDWYPENSEYRYELRRGAAVERPKPKGKHSKLAGDLAFELGLAIRSANQLYFIPKDCVIKLANDTGYEPDVVVLAEGAIATEPRWNENR